jgi:hypothetical protein
VDGGVPPTPDRDMAQEVYCAKVRGSQPPFPGSHLRGTQRWCAVALLHTVWQLLRLLVCSATLAAIALYLLGWIIFPVDEYLAAICFF